MSLHIKLPIGIIARFALKRIVLPALGKAAAKEKITPASAKEALGEALEAEALRQIVKRAG